MNERSLFPHQRLDWMITHLQKKAKQSSGNISMLLNLMKSHLSKGLFHDGGEQSCTEALRQGQKILMEDPNNIDTFALMALASIGMGRYEHSLKYLQKVQKITGKGDAEQIKDNVYIHIAYSSYYQTEHDIDRVLRHLQKAIELAPRAWETHLFLGRVYLALVEKKKLAHNEPFSTKEKRSATRALYHLIQALLSNTFLEKEADFLRDIGLACLINQRYKEAERYFSRLRQRQKNDTPSRYYMGLVTFALEKYNNAAQHFRAFTQENPERLDVLVKQADCFYRLGDYAKVIQLASQCIFSQPENLDARLLLGKAQVELGNTVEAIRVFHEALSHQPEFLPAFAQIITIRRQNGEHAWLEAALCAEVEHYGAHSTNVNKDYSQLIRLRIGVILREMMVVGEDMLPTVLKAINYSQDENLRFALWEVACFMTELAKANQSALALQNVQQKFSIVLGEMLVSLSDHFSTKELTEALKITDADVKNAAVDRYPPAHDVKQHQKHEEVQRQISRAYKALVLLGISSHRSTTALRFLQECNSAIEKDNDLALVINIGLTLNGDIQATERLEKELKSIDKKRILNSIRKQLQQPKKSNGVQELISVTEACQICKKSGTQIHHFLQTQAGWICNLCIEKSRQAMISKDDASCVFCGNNFFHVGEIHSYLQKDICSDCYDHSQTLLEVQSIDSYFVSVHHGFSH